MNHRFIESICFKDGHYHLVELHQARVNRTFENYFPQHSPHNLVEILPPLALKGNYKVRVVYNADTIDIEYAEYHIRKINTLQLVDAQYIDYAYKYEDRSTINQLMDEATADDIIMLKDGLITDSSYANLALWDGSDWITPERTMLAGVKRALLLENGALRTREIHADDLNSFQKISLINAMLDLGDIEILVSDVSQS